MGTTSEKENSDKVDLDVWMIEGELWSPDVQRITWDAQDAVVTFRTRDDVLVWRSFNVRPRGLNFFGIPIIQGFFNFTFTTQRVAFQNIVDNSYSIDIYFVFTNPHTPASINWPFGRFERYILTDYWGNHKPSWALVPPNQILSGGSKGTTWIPSRGGGPHPWDRTVF